MTAERWRQVQAIFNEAVDCDPAARAQVVRERCGNDRELQLEVESLLASEQAPASLLDTPLMRAGALAEVAPLPGAGEMVGRTIGNYIVTGELGHGGMGTVYRARHVSLPREVVVKCIRPLSPSSAVREELRARFRQEAHIQCQLDHPNIVRVYEFFAGEDEYFLVMEYVSGSSIRSMLDSRGLLPVREAVSLAVQALDGLSHAHNLHYVDELGNAGTGVIHRDIKPANLLVDERGYLKLTDFGIAKPQGASGPTKVGRSPGTVEYMSPEQIRALPLDPRSDLYSLGVTLYEMLTGRVPFEKGDSGSSDAVLGAHLQKDPPPIRTFNADIPAPLAAAVMRSLAKHPDRRWQTAAEFREALAANDAGRRRTLWIAAVAALVLISIAAVLWLRPRGERATMQPSIAVLPFLDLTPDKSQEYFSEGLAEELSSALSKTPGLRVAGRTSAFSFKGQTGDIRAIGEKLHVSALLEGSVRRQGNQARITVQLIKTADGFHLWSETYVRQMDDIFAVQEEIAAAVTGALQVKLLNGKPPAQVARSANVKAYNDYLQGRYLLQRSSRENLEKAAGYFEQAIALDPNYAPAWVGLGETRENQAGAAYIPVEEGYRNAHAAVERALALDPQLADAYGILGELQMLRDWDWAGADASFRRALALEPANASVLKGAGSLARLLGRLDEAIAYYRHAIEIDPLWGHKNLGMILYYAGRLDEAKAALDKALELHPDTSTAHAFLSQVFLAQSRPQEALAEAEKERYRIFRLCDLAMAYHDLGKTRESDASLAELIAGFQRDSPYQIAEVYAYRGQIDRGFELLDLAYRLRDPGLTEMKADPLLRNLRKDPRYAALLKKMNLPE